MMTFEDDIEYEGYEYNLDIQTKYTGIQGVSAETITISLVVSLLVGGEMYPADYLSLIYDLKTGSYTCVSELEELSIKLFNTIIKKLDETKARKWGFSFD